MIITFRAFLVRTFLVAHTEVVGSILAVANSFLREDPIGLGNNELNSLKMIVDNWGKLASLFC